MVSLIRRFATHGIAVSEQAATSLFSETWNSDSRWSVIPLGIDLSPFEQDIDKEQVRRELGIPSGTFVVGHVGRFVEVKNHRFLVKIAEHLNHVDSRTMFLLVGDGPLRAEIEALARTKGLADRFVFAGVRTDVARLMKGAMDCFLFPSLYEGLPLALLEAQVAGLQCVVSDTVSTEGDVGSSAVIHLSLSESPEAWASQLTAFSSRRNVYAPPASWRQARSIESSIKRLTSSYDAAFCTLMPNC
jgi:glycosyltransferase involved in cell wall biosynthesis